MEESSEFAPLLAIARQQALASRYEDAVASYVKVLKQIKHAIRSLGDSERAAEWLKLKEDVKLEAKLTLALQRELETFGNRPGPPRDQSNGAAIRASDDWKLREPLRPPSPELLASNQVSAAAQKAITSGIGSSISSSGNRASLGTALLPPLGAMVDSDGAGPVAATERSPSNAIKEAQPAFGFDSRRARPRHPDFLKPVHKEAEQSNGFHNHSPAAARSNGLRTFPLSDDGTPPAGLAAAFYRHRSERVASAGQASAGVVQSAGLDEASPASATLRRRHSSRGFTSANNGSSAMSPSAAAWNEVFAQTDARGIIGKQGIIPFVAQPSDASFIGRLISDDEISAAVQRDTAAISNNSAISAENVGSSAAQNSKRAGGVTDERPPFGSRNSSPDLGSRTGVSAAAASGLISGPGRPAVALESGSGLSPPSGGIVAFSSPYDHARPADSSTNSASATATAFLSAYGPVRSAQPRAHSAVAGPAAYASHSSGSAPNSNSIAVSVLPRHSIPSGSGGAASSSTAGSGGRNRVVTKPAVPKQSPPLPRSNSSASNSAAAGARGRPGGTSATGPGGRPPYSEVHSLSADRDLIAMVEGDMLEVNPNVTFASIAGLEDAKALIQEAVILPMLLPQYFRGIRRPWKGVLLFGPPGTGKTLLAKAVATECKTTFFNVTASTLTSKWRGESERILRLVFDMARYYAPSVVFFDEIDALAGSRGGPNEHEASRRVKTELLVQMDGISSLIASTSASSGPDVRGGGSSAGISASGAGADDASDVSRQVVVLAASNLPWELDEAFRRRFEKRIHIPLPSLGDRRALFDIALRDIQLGDGVDFDALAARTEGFSGADIATLSRTAAMMPIRKILEAARRAGGGGVEAMRRVLAEQGITDNDTSKLQLPVEWVHFLDALASTKPSVSTGDNRRYEEWMAEFGSV